MFFVGRINVESGKEKDAESYRPWTENTTTVAFSCTKGPQIAICGQREGQHHHPQHRDTATIFQELIGRPFSMWANITVLKDKYAQDTKTLNNPTVREVTISSASGTGTARGLARLYGIIANGGSVGGDSLLSRDSIKYLSTPIIFGKDTVFITGEETSFGLGTFYRKNPKGQDAVGHTGHGGQVAIGDEANALGIAYLTNHLSINGIGDDPRYVDLENALYRVIDRLQTRT
ncbi:hypothetical protein DPMN_151292 [Dreissena polymorpha]|uniref:Beta-lactamase-related domain-containing protein n=1 Tax=Dreissena polymorpha TaxID=45954 RepID=A0A9D4J443_DREPO|nr:hypothetical protein DPMN_151292 [Dreissena polymorpha]